MLKLKSRNLRRLGLVAGAGLAFVAAPALAQAVYTLDEVVVSPRLGPDGQRQTLSRTVDISDLDLRYDRDVRVMRERVRDTARRVCRELGETDVIPTVERNCVNDAVDRTQGQIRVAIAQARAPTYYAYAPVPAAPVAPYAGYYAPPASAVVPVYPTYPTEPYTPPDL